MAEREDASTYQLEGTLPLYRRLVPLAPDKHGGLALLDTGEPYGFAQEAALVPITIDEFERAMLAFPIVLMDSGRRAAIVVGLEPDRNLFVSETGGYAPGIYIPAYLRRHPFALANGDDGEQVVCIDEAADRLVLAGTANARPLFDGDDVSEKTRAAIAMCTAFAEAERNTAAFLEAMAAHELLDHRRATYRRAGAEEHLLDYTTVSRERLDALAPTALAELRDKGWLAPAYAQIFSAANWEVLTLWAT